MTERLRVASRKGLFCFERRKDGWQAGPPLASLPALAWLIVELRGSRDTV